MVKWILIPDMRINSQLLARKASRNTTNCDAFISDKKESKTRMCYWHSCNYNWDIDNHLSTLIWLWNCTLNVYGCKHISNSGTHCLFTKYLLVQLPPDGLHCLTTSNVSLSTLMVMYFPLFCHAQRMLDSVGQLYTSQVQSWYLMGNRLAWLGRLTLS